MTDEPPTPVSPVKPIEQGTEIAWVMRTPKGATCGVSVIHRVFEKGMTYCSVVLPAEAVRFPPLISLNRCNRCDRMHTRAKQYIVESVESRESSAEVA